MADSSVRINKYLSETGVCSRRQADQWVEAGRVAVNGVTAVLGTKVAAGDEVSLDGRPLNFKPERVYLALNKPIGIECTTDRDVPDNIVDFVGHRERVFPIGRLDKESEGLILLTSNGDIVNEILRAENKHEKEYHVAVNKPVTDEFLRGMARGVRVHNEMTLPCKTAKLAKFGFRIVLTQGLNRQIRLMSAAFDYRVKQLRRVRIDNLKLGALKPGQWRNLTEMELRGLLPLRTEW